ncbi:MAG: hypothetical protein WC378_20805 [Opitutaceae bacterium]
MRSPFHLFHRERHGSSEAAVEARMMPRMDLQWGRRVVTPPALPTPKVLIEELRFAMDFRPGNRTRR